MPGSVGLGAGVPGAVVVGVLGAVAFTDLLLPEEVPVGNAVPETGLGRTGDRTECADGDAPDRSLVAEAEAGCAGADVGGVGPVHGLDVTYKLWVAGLPEPDPEAGVVAVGVGLAEPVGAGVGGVVVGVMLGAVVGAVVGVTEGTGATMPGVVGFALGTVLVGFTHVDVGDGLAVYFPVPRGPVGTPATPGSGWPVPLLLAPPSRRRPAARPAARTGAAGRGRGDAPDRIPEARDGEGGPGEQADGGEGHNEPQPDRADPLVCGPQSGDGPSPEVPHPGGNATGCEGIWGGRYLGGRSGFESPRRYLPAPPGEAKKPR